MTSRVPTHPPRQHLPIPEDLKEESPFPAILYTTDRLRKTSEHHPPDQGEVLHSSIENEKCKLGQELHDGVNPLLSAALLYLNLIKPVSKRGKKVKETVHTILMEAVGCIRTLASDLVVLEQEQYTLKELVENYLEKIKSIVHFSITIDFENTEVLRQITNHEKTYLYRIIQEQINNIIKYSKASKVHIQLKNEHSELCLIIQDDGIGFDTSVVNKGIGLLNMKKRMEELHGTLNIKSSPGNGCIVYILLPLQGENSPVSFYSY